MSAKRLSVLVLAVMSTAGWGQSPLQDRFALSTGQVARALSAGGMQITGEQVSLPARIVATEPTPELDILSVEPLGKAQLAGHSPDRFRVRLGCHLSGECLPFYAFVRWSEPTTGSAARPSGASGLTRNIMFSPQNEIIMRAGAHATLVIDDGRSHIQIAVISLENGIAGHRIRVCSPDRKQVYFGEVVSARLLEGSF
jgi:hypothetical protein